MNWTDKNDETYWNHRMGKRIQGALIDSMPNSDYRSHCFCRWRENEREREERNKSKSNREIDEHLCLWTKQVCYTAPHDSLAIETFHGCHTCVKIHENILYSITEQMNREKKKNVTNKEYDRETMLNSIRTRYTCIELTARRTID